MDFLWFFMFPFLYLILYFVFCILNFVLFFILDFESIFSLHFSSQIFWLDVFEGAVACSSQNGDVALVNGEGEIVWHVKSSQWGAGSPCSAWMCRIDANGVYVGHSEGVAKYDFKGKRVVSRFFCCCLCKCSSNSVALIGF